MTSGVGVVITRLCLAYPRFLRRDHANLIETIRSPRRSEAFWFGVILAVVGFLYSIGWNSVFYRFLYDEVPGFKSIRAPMRGAMFACLGLALLSGLGTKRIAEFVVRRWPRVKPPMVYGGCCLLLLLELNGDATAAQWQPHAEVFEDKQHIARAAMQLTALQLTDLTLSDLIQKAASLQKGTVYSVIPAVKMGKAAVEFLIAAPDGQTIELTLDAKTGQRF